MTGPVQATPHDAPSQTPIMVSSTDAANATAGGGGSSQTALARAAQFSSIGLFVLALAVLATVTRPVLVPVIVAIVIGTILMPLVAAAEERKVPRVLSAGLLTALLAVLAAGAVTVLAMPISYWISRASEFGAILRDRLSAIDQPLAALQQFISAMQDLTGGPRPVVAVDTSQSNLLETVLGVVTPALGQFLLFLGALIFYLVHHSTIKRASVLFFGDRDVRLRVLRIISDVERQMSVYFGTVAVINAGLGVATALAAWLAGLANPVLWGILAGVMNFVPYLGSAIVTLTLLLVGILTFPTLGPALVAPALFLFLTTIEGQIISPSVVGRRLTMNPFLVFLAMGFWTWLWGPVGAFLAVPIVLAGVVTARHLMPDDKPDLPD